MKKISCPNCSEALEQVPKARKKCPDCKEWIYVKKPFKSDKKVTTKILMTKAQADITDEKYRKYYELKSCGGLTLKAWSVKKMAEAADDLTSGNIDDARSKYLEVKGKVKDQKIRYTAHKEFCKCELSVYKKETETNYIRINRPTNTHLPCHKTETPQDKLMSIDDAFKKMPVPCNKELCGCFYTQVFEEEMPRKKNWWKILR